MSKERTYAGIDIGGTSVKFGLVDASGKILHREQKPTLAEKGPVPLMHLVNNIGERLLLVAAEEELHVDWLGVGTPGAVDFRTGQVIGPSPNIAGWQGMELGENLRERLNLPVYVDNDANCVALAESRFGAGFGSKSMLCVTVGTGIGGAFLVDGKVWRGASWSSGELGHMAIDFEGPVCTCGATGCIEVYCASKAITDRAKKRLKDGLTPIFAEVLDGDLGNLTIRKLFAAVNKGDEVAREVVDESAWYLGVGLAGVVNLLNPETVVIGGGIADAGGGYIEAVAAEIKNRAFDSAVEGLSVVKASLGNDAGFIGAGLLGEEVSR